MFLVIKIIVSLIRVFNISTTYVMAETFDYALLSWGLFNGYYNTNDFLSYCSNDSHLSFQLSLIDPAFPYCHLGFFCTRQHHPSTLSFHNTSPRIHSW